MSIREGRLWEEKVPGLGLEGHKNGAEAEERKCWGEGFSGDRHEMKTQRRYESTDMLRKLFGRVSGEPQGEGEEVLAVLVLTPTPTHHLQALTSSLSPARCRVC